MTYASQSGRARSSGRACRRAIWSRQVYLSLAGGIWLGKEGVVDKRLPLAFIITLVLISNFFAVVDYSSYSSALFHTLSGGTMLAAFFIITDPVSASTTPRGRIIYVAGIAARFGGGGHISAA